MSNLAQRVAVALVAIPLMVIVTLAGGWYFFAMVLLISTLGLHEFYSLAEKKGAHPQVATGMLFGASILCVFIWERLKTLIVSMAIAAGYQIPMPTMAQLFLILCLLFIPVMMCLELLRNKGSALYNLSATLFGVLYVSFFLGTLIGLRELFIPQDFPYWLHLEVTGIDLPPEAVEKIYGWGGLTILTLFVSIWVCDSLAYFTGSAIGRHKLFPRVSPNKTWEGAVAGYVGAIGIFLLAQAYVLPYMSVANAVVCGSIVGIFGQIGDLAESLLKRDAGIKDSSALIPGHGGVLDRFDSMTFVSPLIFYYLDFVVF